MLRRSIEVTGQYIGFHAYEDAPAKVAFLKSRHRHLFKWHAQIEVFHEDRELEFFIVQEFIEQAVAQMCAARTNNLGSCEQQAEVILMAIKKEYGDNRWIRVSVSEDGENAGAVSWLPL